MTWADEAACLNADPAIFDQRERGETAEDYQLRLGYARWYCQRCPVLMQCAADAETTDVVGFRAGVMRGHNATSERVQRCLDEGTSWRAHGLTKDERKELAILLRHRGLSVRETSTRTGLMWQAIAYLYPDENTRPKKPVPCGTETAYKRHLAREEPIDPLCKEAARRRSIESYHRNKAKKAARNGEVAA